MTDKTRQILAMTFGAVGLLVAIIATVIALNARQVADDEQVSSAVVQQEVAAELNRRARQEKKGLTRIERFVNQLSREEKSAIGSFRSLKRRVSGLSRELDAVESKQKSDYAGLNKRIDATNRSLSNLRRQVQRLKDQLQLLEAANQP